MLLLIQCGPNHKLCVIVITYYQLFVLTFFLQFKLSFSLESLEQFPLSYRILRQNLHGDSGNFSNGTYMTSCQEEVVYYNSPKLCSETWNKMQQSQHLTDLFLDPSSTWSHQAGFAPFLVFLLLFVRISFRFLYPTHNHIFGAHY
uniref:Uncharacterized protein n=1 Tax=Cacopsylla melanoneura TaxID=428564 RepID=A0A8D8U179_9HEMI